MCFPTPQPSYIHSFRGLFCWTAEKARIFMVLCAYACARLCVWPFCLLKSTRWAKIYCFWVARNVTEVVVFRAILSNIVFWRTLVPCAKQQEFVRQTLKAKQAFESMFSFINASKAFWKTFPPEAWLSARTRVGWGRNNNASMAIIFFGPTFVTSDTSLPRSTWTAELRCLPTHPHPHPHTHTSPPMYGFMNCRRAHLHQYSEVTWCNSALWRQSCPCRDDDDDDNVDITFAVDITC